MAVFKVRSSAVRGQANEVAPVTSDLHLILGQSNAGGGIPYPSTVAGEITAPGVAWGATRHPAPLTRLVGPLQNGERRTAGIGTSSFAPWFASEWHRRTGRSSIWSNMSAAGQALVPEAIPENNVHWSVRPFASSLVGVCEGFEERPRNALMRDFFNSCAHSSMHQPGLRIVHWCQGEADANSLALGRLEGEDYRAALSELFGLLSDVHRIDAFFVYELGRKGRTPEEVDRFEPAYCAIRNAQAAVVAERDDTHFVFTHAKEPGTPFNTLAVDENGYHLSGFKYMSDGVHFDSTAQRAMGLTGARNAARTMGLEAPVRNVSRFRKLLGVGA